jgi:hypothetical protein
VERLQLVLDGELPAAALDADAHLTACAACRERITAARLVLSALAKPCETAVPPGLTDAILSAVREDRYARIRRRSYQWTTGVIVALAASIALLTWLLSPDPRPLEFDGPRPSDMTNKQPTPQVAPEPRPVRIGDEFSKMGQALRETSKPITEPVGAAPQIIVKLTDTLTRPIAPTPAFEPARKSLVELPDAARAGLEPITGTAQKAFSRFLRDVGSVQVSRPKS